MQFDGKRNPTQIWSQWCRVHSYVDKWKIIISTSVNKNKMSASWIWLNIKYSNNVHPYSYRMNAWAPNITVWHRRQPSKITSVTPSQVIGALLICTVHRMATAHVMCIRIRIYSTTTAFNSLPIDTPTSPFSFRMMSRNTVRLRGFPIE